MASSTSVLPALPKFSSEALKHLIDRLPVLIFDLSVDGSILYANPAALLATGYSQAELISKNWAEVFFPVEAQPDGKAFVSGLKEDEVTGVMLSLLTNRGESLMVEITSTNYVAGGRLERVTLMGVDITASRHSQDALMSNIDALRISDEKLRIQNERLSLAHQTNIQERRRYQDLFEFAPNGYLLTSTTGLILEANRTAAHLFQVGKEFLVGKPLVVFLAEADRASFAYTLNHVAQGDNVQGCEVTLLARGGSQVTVMLLATPVFDAEGGLVSLRWALHDISARKIIEGQLAYQALLLENVHDAIVATNAQLVITAWNKTAEEIYGWSKAEVLGRHIQEVLLHNMAEVDANKLFADLKETGLYRGEIVQQRRDGSLFTVDMRASALFNENHQITGYIAVNRDITERIQNEIDLREKNDMIMTAANSLPITLFLLDRDGTLRVSLGKSASRELLNIEPVGRSIYDLYRDVPTAIENFHRALAGEVFESLMEIGSRTYETHYAPLQADDGEITGVVGVGMDVTQRKMSEEALHDSQARFRIVFEYSEIGIDLLDLHGRFVTANPALQKMLGYTAEELSRLTVTDITHPADAAYSLPFFHELAAGRRETYQVEKRYIRKDGATVWAFVTTSLVRDARGEPQFALTMVENITDRKLMQVELQEVQRRLMDSAEGERLHLAQELHDGPVQDLYGLVYVIEDLRSQITSPAVLEHLASMKSTITKITGELRNTARDLRPPALAPFGLEKAILSHATQFEQENPQIKVYLNLTPDGQLLPERVRLALFRIYQQSLVNVKRHAEATRVDVRFHLDVEQVSLEIEDNGKGFEVPRRWIALVRGGHFGLAGSSERAEAIGGKLTVQSQPGQGALIRVTLPFPEEE